jgi:hypothetical protein
VRTDELGGVTPEYERRLWDDLNELLADLVPEDATPEEGQRVVDLAIRGHCTEVSGLYLRIRETANDLGSGYLWDRLHDDNPVGRASRPVGR